MQLTSQEHYELIEQFERTFIRDMPLTREAKEYWAKGAIYTNGETNKAFLAYRHGYAFGRAKHMAD